MSFCWSNAPDEFRNSMKGFCRSDPLPMPEPVSEGPSPRTTTSFDALPVMMNPAIMMLSPVSTRNRVEMFRALAGAAVGVAVGVEVAVALAVAVGDAVAVALAVAVGVAVAVAVAVGATVAVGVAVAVAVAVGVAVAVAVAVAVGVTVAVAVGVGDATPQLPSTLNTMFISGKPITAVSVGVVIPHDAALM